MRRHFELYENFNFIEEGNEVVDEEIAASELDLDNIFIIRPERSPPISQASHSSSISTTTSSNSIISTT